MTGRREPIRLTPAYLATGGRSSARRPLPDVLTRLTGGTDVPPPAGLTAVQYNLLVTVGGGRAHGGALTLADAASYLQLPASAIRVLANDLMDLGLIDAVEPAQLPDVALLENVLHGLRKLRDTA